jgi:hypothetical protein
MLLLQQITPMLLEIPSCRILKLQKHGKSCGSSRFLGDREAHVETDGILALSCMCHLLELSSSWLWQVLACSTAYVNFCEKDQLSKIGHRQIIQSAY